MTFIAGAYTATVRKRLNGDLEGTIASPTDTPLGQIEDGINVEFTQAFEPVRGDNMGDSIQDGVFRGGDCFMDFSLVEWDLALISGVFWPGADNTNTVATAFANLGTLESGYIGRLATSLAFPIVLTKLTGPNAVPAFIFAAKALLAPGYPARFILAPRLRRIPIRLQLYPYQRTAGVGNSYFWFEGAATRPAEIED